MSSEPGPEIPARRPGEAPIDSWTLVHLAAGAAIGLLHIPVLWALGGLFVYEAVEGALRRIPGTNGKGLFEYESWWNIAVDVVAAAVAYVLVTLGLYGSLR